MANDKDSKGAHEESYRRQRIDVISNVPDQIPINKPVGITNVVFLMAECLLPEMPALHVVIALFRSEPIAGECATSSQLHGRSKPSSTVHGESLFQYLDEFAVDQTVGKLREESCSCINQPLHTSIG